MHEETTATIGQLSEEPLRRNLFLRLPEEDKFALKVLAKRSRMSLDTYVNTVLSNAIETKEIYQYVKVKHEDDPTTGLMRLPQGTIDVQSAKSARSAKSVAIKKRTTIKNATASKKRTGSTKGSSKSVPA